MAAKGTKRPGEAREPKKRTPTFLLELPLVVDAAQAKHVRAHLEVGRQFYNALLSEGQCRLRQMWADPAWQAARAIPRSRKQERQAAFSALREQYGFSENALHEYAKAARVSWLADHLEAVLAQTLASRAYQALNRVCLGQARRVRFKSRGRGLDSVENKRIDWNDPVVKYGLDHRIKYARLIRRKASSSSAQGADCQGYRYYVQLALEGLPHHKPKHTVGSDTIGLDTGPSTIAIVPKEGEARLDLFCEELTPGEQAIRRLQRKMDRQRRAANPANYDEKGRPKKRGKQGLVWKTSKGYEATRRRKATKERKRKAHRKSLHGRKVHELVHVGSTIHVEKISYKGWQKRYGKSVGLRAPGMFIDHLRRTVVSTGGILIEHPTRTTKLSQFCHGRLSRNSRRSPLVCPVRCTLGRCGGAPASSTRASQTMCECGAGRAPKHGHPPCQSASAQKFERTHTRARLAPLARKAGSVEGTLGTPCALARGAISYPTHYTG